MQIGMERRKANPCAPSEWFFLNYLRKLGEEGTFSQLISDTASVESAIIFLAYLQHNLCIWLHQKECK
ncbi:hypothetical protein HA48_04055 [Pantoea wallisii]|uniref:Uncharacterized protein n=1 Tax=Pantoea wallisii TaxID=1076551 RepID=A0A1X1DD29_9GAMM|nr:hypothetical protein HA48_04055 [Pantoea wallisii]